MSNKMCSLFSGPWFLDYLCRIQPRINNNNTNGFCQKAHLLLFCCSLWLQKHTKKTQIKQDCLGSEHTSLYPSHAAVQLLLLLLSGEKCWWEGRVQQKVVCDALPWVWTIHLVWEQKVLNGRTFAYLINHLRVLYTSWKHSDITQTVKNSVPLIMNGCLIWGKITTSLFFPVQSYPRLDIDTLMQPQI